MSNKATAKFPEKYWYGKGAGTNLWLCLSAPLTLLFMLLSALRRLAYRWNILKTQQFSVPVIVVGNITVGGTGKTPLVIALVERLRRAGWRPGVVSRGYGGVSKDYPLQVTAQLDVTLSGDEPGLIARRTGCPVIVDPKRSRAVKLLASSHAVDVVVSDDGLQHYAMGRDAELAVVDAERRLGNGWLLPSGPLREKPARLNEVDAVVINGGDDDEAAMRLRQSDPINLRDGSRLPLRAFAGRRGHAVAGIGHPERFFSQLEEHGLNINRHVFPDHHSYCAEDLQFGDNDWILMTEKDAIKCASFAGKNCWYVPVDAEFNARADMLLEKLVLGLRALRK